MNDATLVRKGLFRKKMRAVLLILSILIAFLIFGVLGAFYSVFTAGVDVAAANRLVTVNRINFTMSMPFAYWGRVQQVEGVDNVTHASWFGGYYQEPRNFVQSFAVDPESYLAAYPELVMPEDQRQAFLTNRTCLLVGADLAGQFSWSVGDRIPLLSNIWQKRDGSSSWDFDICAIFDGNEATVPANYAMFHYDYYNEDLAFNNDQIGWMVINTTDPSVNDRVAREIDNLFANSPAETETSTEAAFNQAFLEQFGNIALILVLVIGAAFATILMIVGTTMVMAINERTKEIAVMKTLGFNEGRIFGMVLSESILLSLIGGLIGLGLATLMVTGAAAALAGFLPGLSMPLSVVLVAIALMIGLGLVTGIVPAINATRIRIVEALGKT
ncbi:ABC transporter permease [Hyphobacterium marinum]|uniref:FtsX-like permease family protein n=1 Tax=Hyphobacterium marinum TaxID=3116574 RepID=A0ABU7LXK2_9PROT|nr:FtsX-like permease family protein [Hyphobacterium sp. Y6023]MEE2566276.1 FtsX-like permease family protein [Hyphobacterium sp. Y6023]